MFIIFNAFINLLKVFEILIRLITSMFCHIIELDQSCYFDEKVYVYKCLFCVNI